MEKEKVDDSVYSAEEVMVIYRCSEKKAYKVIKGLNDKLVELGVPEESLNKGKISKKFFHETLRI